MLEALTIFTKGGLVLYHYRASPSLIGDDDDGHITRTSCNKLLSKVILEHHNPNNKQFHIDQGLSFVWRTDLARDYVIIAVYPDILFEGPRQYLKQWAETLVVKASQEYNVYYKAVTAATTTNTTAPADGKGIDATKALILQRPEENPEAFDKTFRLLLDQSKTQRPPASEQQQQQQQQGGSQPTPANDGGNNNNKVGNKPTTSSGSTKGKEKRQWHDGKAKVTEKAMAELDKSAPEAATDQAKAEAYERALQEARRTYLPSESELQQQDDEDGTGGNNNNNNAEDDENANSWSSSVTGLLQQLTGNKVLTKSDLEKPLNSMRDLLTQKNVARYIAVELCQAVETSLVGKRLNSLYRVQTAVQQAMEKAVLKILNKKDIDLVRAIMTKRGDGSIFRSSSSSNTKPYVIVVMGINGIGKTTSLAKLAYYLSNNNCKPLLVAGDTFRSGAVEQLQVHATCLDLPLFSQGYSKDPSAVAKAAITHATEQGNDVVLMDTAGRMQNNVPLMKALGKLVKENKPDCILLVAEALVGHDGLDQFRMFQKAIMPRTIDGLLLTKYDTVSDKVGAALTLTHETGSPIVFVGTGQKYHHLKKPNVSQITNSLFS